MARLETIRAATIKQQLWQIRIDLRRQVEAELKTEYAKRHGPDAAELHRRLGLIEEALGIRFDWGDERLFHGVNVADLARIGAATKQYGSVTAAVEALTAPIRGPLASVRAKLNHLERELEELRAIAAPASEQST